MVGGVVGQVVESNDPRVAKDDIVEGMLGWQDYAMAPAEVAAQTGSRAARSRRPCTCSERRDLTAYFGLLDICRPQPGETVVVSGAGGAVGSIVGQIAKIKRCRSIGVVGSNEKVRFITRELGFDGGLNSRDHGRFSGRGYEELCPERRRRLLRHRRRAHYGRGDASDQYKARIAVCDQISMYNPEEPDTGPAVFCATGSSRRQVEGFVVQQFADRFEEGLRQLATWLREKKLKYHEDIVEGLENAPRALIEMLEGQNMGKRLVKVAA